MQNSKKPRAPGWEDRRYWYMSFRQQLGPSGWSPDADVITAGELALSVEGDGIISRAVFQPYDMAASAFTDTKIEIVNPRRSKQRILHEIGNYGKFQEWLIGDRYLVNGKRIHAAEIDPAIRHGLVTPVHRFSSMPDLKITRQTTDEGFVAAQDYFAEQAAHREVVNNRAAIIELRSETVYKCLAGGGIYAHISDPKFCQRIGNAVGIVSDETAISNVQINHYPRGATLYVYYGTKKTTQLFLSYDGEVELDEPQNFSERRKVWKMAADGTVQQSLRASMNSSDHFTVVKGAAAEAPKRRLRQIAEIVLPMLEKV